MQRTNLLSIRFEPLSEEAENLLGGFSASLSATSFQNGSEANNCHGGNCATGCGSGQQVNNIAGCGKL
jgi:hypothetical protein